MKINFFGSECKKSSFISFMNKGLHQLVVCFILSISLVACGDDEDTIAPKPRAYFRIDFPEKKYVLYDSACPFTFEIPVYSQMETDKDGRSEPCWLNLNFPEFQGTMHLTYKPVNNNIQSYLEDTYEFLTKHHIKASGIDEQLVAKDSDKVYGLIYQIKGNAASSVQFFLTDSVHHFIRGALYFNVAPNIDSIAPVIEFIQKDIQQMVTTFKWKDNADISGSSSQAVHKKQDRGK